MNIQETIILGRNDLLDKSNMLDLNKIEWVDFKNSQLETKDQAFVIFVDNDGETRIFKNRFGNSGMISRNNLNFIPRDNAKKYFKILIKDLPESLRIAGQDESFIEVIEFLENQYDATFIHFVNGNSIWPLTAYNISYFIFRSNKS